MCLALHPFLVSLLDTSVFTTATGSTSPYMSPSVSFQHRQTCQSGRILVPCPHLCPVLWSVLTSPLAFKSSSVLPYFYTSTTAILSATMSSNASASTSLRVLRGVPLSTTASVSASFCSSALASRRPVRLQIFQFALLLALCLSLHIAECFKSVVGFYLSYCGSRRENWFLAVHIHMCR